MSCELIGLPRRATIIDHLEDWREAVDAFRRCVSTTADRHEGFIARHAGNATLVLFGYPAAHEHDAERAVRAGLELCAAVGALKPVVGVPMRCRVGISTGMVIVGNFVGVGERRVQDCRRHPRAGRAASDVGGTGYTGDRTRHQAFARQPIRLPRPGRDHNRL